MGLGQHWDKLDTDELSTLKNWRVVAVESLLKLPGLRHFALRERALLVRTRDGKHLLLLRMPRPWMSLGERLFGLEPLPNRQGWLLALQAGEGQARSGAPELPEGPARLQLDVDNWPELWFGELRLGRSLHPRSRDWAWAWSPSCGPVSLRIYLDRSPEQIGDWLHSLQPGLWELHPTGLLHSRLHDESRLSLSPGRLCLMRRFSNSLPEQLAYEYVMLVDLASGALGPLQFDLFDGDYLVFQASGESGRSLWEYLHTRSDRSRPHLWNRFVKVEDIDARAATVEESAHRIGTSMGWGELSFVEVCLRFQQTPVPELPRSLKIQVLRDVLREEVRNELAYAQPRVQFWFSLH